MPYIRWAILLVVMISPSLAAPKLDWHKAVLVEIHRTEQGRDWAYTFDLGDRLVFCADPPVRMRLKPLDIAVGSEVQVARSGSNLVVIDRKGKQQKLVIQREVMKPANR